MARRLAALAAAALLAVACSGGDGQSSVEGGDTSVAVIGPGSTTVSSAPDSSTTTTGGTDPAPDPPPSGGGGGTSTTPPTDSGSLPPDPGVDTTPEVAAAARGFVGDFAPALLRADLTKSVVVEVLVQSGAAPRRASTEYLTGVLRDVTGKPVREVSGTIAGDRRDWSPDDVVAAGDAAVVEQQGSSQAVMRLLFLRGTFAGNGDVLGVALRGDLAAIFVDRVKAAASPLIGSGEIEGAVTVHEAGHLLGLVDLYLSTGRQDPDHPGHSRNTDSVMYWAIESGLISDILTGGPSQDFDAEDLADLAAIRAGA